MYGNKQCCQEEQRERVGLCYHNDQLKYSREEPRYQEGTHIIEGLNRDALVVRSHLTGCPLSVR